jgi:HEPN domain-containing protein/predicted nucleotidyltransferase
VLSTTPVELSTDAVVRKRIRDATLKETAAHAVYLFGSRARGDHRPDSDYDVLVVTWETDRTREIQRAIGDAVRELGVDADVHVVDPPTFLWRARFENTVERAASRQGVVLFMVEREDELREAAGEWFRIGDDDFATAEWCSQNGRPSNACFNAQQCVEKYLKGYLTFREVDVSRTHALDELLEPCVRLDGTFEQWREPLVPFKEYAVKTRYPHRYTPSSDEARKAVEVACSLRDFILARVEP